MPDISLPEADNRSCALDIASYELALDLTQGTDTFRSLSQIRFRCKRDDVVAFADLQAVSIGQMALNGIPLAVGRAHDGRLDLPPVAGENTLVVEAEFAYAFADEGLNRVADPADGSICVYSKTNQGGAPRVFCCFDQPDLRAPFTVSVHAPAGWSRMANGCAPNPANRRGVSRFAQTTPIAPYQLAVCAGSFRAQTFVRERPQGRALPITLWGMPRSAALRQAEVVLDLLEQPLQYYERTLGVPYPFGKCDLVFVAGFPALGFSAPGLITIRDEVLEAGEGKSALYRATVIAHELAHAWIGALTDIRRDDMWLQEALTTYLSRSAVAESKAATAPWDPSVSATLPDHGYAEDAEQLRRLEKLIGRQAVMLGLGSLLHRHAHGTATKADFVRCWSEASGRDLGGWAAETLIPATNPDDQARAANAIPRR